MSFNPGLETGAELTNSELCELFQCGNMGGMRRSKRTNTLVIISDDTKDLYRDVWRDGILHYTGMGKVGDQVLEGNQNRTLYYSEDNGVEIHIFEVFDKGVYTYRGIARLVGKPYEAFQQDDQGNMRKVWIFPLKPLNTWPEEQTEPLEKDIVRLSNQDLDRRSKRSHGKRAPRITESMIYYRDPYLKEIVRRIADGKCQLCGMAAPFIDRNNEPYLEEHHVQWLADGGEDTIDNVVALCPNCHRKIHILKAPTDVLILERVAEANRRKFDRLISYEKKIARLK